MVSFSVVLYCRLISYDRNRNFANEPVQITAPTKPIDWPTIGFRQLMNNSRSECPPLTAELIQSYFATWLGYDQPDVNIPALRKGKLLFLSCIVNNQTTVCIWNETRSTTYRFRANLELLAGDIVILLYIQVLIAFSRIRTTGRSVWCHE